jgi:UDP-4-amino-4-deoxy-L-arabinose-oxoglutarate aminotransferase
LKSGWSASGIKVKQLEEAITHRTGAKHAIAVSSSTAGMRLILHARGIGPGDEVIIPSMSCVSTVNVILLSGATPVFVDIDRNTLMTEARIVERAITKNTRLIVPVHFAGAPLELGPLRLLASRYGIALVEDAAHALGTRYLGIPIGCTGTCIFSLQASNSVTTAEGGVICTDDDRLATRLRRLRFHGLETDAFDRLSGGRLPSAEVVEPGFKCNLLDLYACLALGELARLEENNAARTKYARRYIDAFTDKDTISPLSVPEWVHRHSWHLFVVRVEIDRLKISRDQFMSELRVLGVGSGLHFRAVHHHKFYRSRKFPGQDQLPNTDWNTERVVSLPLFPGMNEVDVTRVVDAVEFVLQRFAE